MTLSGESKKTTDHDTIRKWADDRGGRPAGVAGTGGGDDPGILRIVFAGQGSEDSLEDISWDEFFQKFDDNDLAFLYQEETAEGEESRFFKFVKR